MCFAPQRRAIFGHVNFKKWPESVVFSTFWLTNMLRATAACHFWKSERPKWLRPCGVFHILTCKCAFRHSRVAFWNIGTSKMSPALRCFLHFDAQMCFSPQPRGILEHRNFQNVSGAEVFSTFWRANVLRATAACHFSPVCQNCYLRTRRFSEATFRTSGTTTHWKNTAIRDVTNIWRACWTPGYWLYAHVDLLATDSTRMLIFLLLTWLLCDSAFQLYILSEVRLLNFLRQTVNYWNIRTSGGYQHVHHCLHSWLSFACPTNWVRLNIKIVQSNEAHLSLELSHEKKTLLLSIILVGS